MRIYSNTDMERLALDHGVPKHAISVSENLAYHDMPTTLPFEKTFMARYQADLLNEYFLSKDRLIARLPHQMTALTEDELVQKYDSYIPTKINSLQDVLDMVGIERSQLGVQEALGEEVMKPPHIYQTMKNHFVKPQPAPDALRVLMIDASQYFLHDEEMLFDVVEPPLGLMYVLTYLQHRMGNNVQGKIIKSRVDYKDYTELKQKLEDFNPHIIGMRSLTFYRDLFHQTVAVIRQWNTEIPSS